MEDHKQFERLIEAYERREEIHLGRPLTWAVKLGLVALVITVFWLVSSGAELDAVLWRGLVGFLVFAGAGYTAGRLLEKPPAVEPIQPRQDETSTRGPGHRLKTEALRPGMKLVEPVRKSDGEVLISEDTTLSEELLGVMREYAIPEAVVTLTEGGEKHDEQATGK